MSDDDVGRDIGDATVLRATDRALLVRLSDFNNREVWIPKSQIHDDSEVYAIDTAGVLIVSEWLARKLEL